jgi:hypothetical protein
MESCELGPCGGPEPRRARERAAASPFEAALFTGAVLAASVFAFSATAGSVGRALWRMAILLGFER